MNAKKVIIISTSPRVHGNSDTLAAYFANGARESGHDVEEISLTNKNINFCKGCLVCQNNKPCVIKDDANKIIESIKNADVVVFATPIYFYEMCGQMKTLLDRTNPLFIQDYQFRDIYLLATCADENEAAIDTAISGLQGWIQCFDKCKLKDVIKGLGIDQYGAIKEHNDKLQEAYELGKKV